MTSVCVARVGRRLCLGGRGARGCRAAWLGDRNEFSHDGRAWPAAHDAEHGAGALVDRDRGSAASSRHHRAHGCTLSVLAALGVLGIGVGTLAEYRFAD